ncbi:ABC-three component system middle component 1 [Photobacterium salinisoli]|uniref:ABC-three component system middle component 1 n=1 Tax=Photobacterium salinisoli TaxID=1616783 RepID=UPI000EA21F0B|nr:ABC-three component system middle component 1 [Photobacterium salinisoli]
MKNDISFEENHSFSDLVPDYNIRKFVLSCNMTMSAKVNAFCLVFEKESDLKEQWEDIADVLNYEYLSANETTEFERWNNYLIFIVTGETSLETKYEIENDKFYMRKLVLELSTKSEEILKEKTIEFLNNRLLLRNFDLSNNTSNNDKWKELLGGYSKSITSENITFGRDRVSKDARVDWINRMLGQ